MSIHVLDSFQAIVDHAFRGPRWTWGRTRLLHSYSRPINTSRAR